MKYFPFVLLAITFGLPLAGCNASVEEQAPPTSAPEMSAEEKSNYEKQMEMMQKSREAQQ